MKTRRLQVLAGIVLAALAAAASTSAPPARAASPGFDVTFRQSPTRGIGRPSKVAVRVVNNWPAAVRSVSLVVVGPAWLRIRGERCVARTAGVRCRLGDLAAGAASTTRLVVTPTRAGTYRLVARVSATAVDEPTAGG